MVMKKRRVKRRLKVDRLILVIVLGIGLALGTYFGIRYLLKSNNDKPINKPSEEEKEKGNNDLEISKILVLLTSCNEFI